ncbi:MAG: cyclic nucleotide-binding domain-containing protein [Chloroflexi bacterium]|nr:cyclic nucleotide-binding domain-containing protein [Chloroflexota bacterium]MCI0575548.1 cyclic nucleotide-binding domain-containing protein [Chloroflexota bacterium]MCI0644088.1 cyclic nucleotide-binding domain-containing protein [Chloroflexota bacterium]MCI0727904.1 cyclic nucleotide-binding domain-containing protein [Chloroflexota bacterium]
MIDAYFPIIFDLGLEEDAAGTVEEPKGINFLTENDWRLLLEKSHFVSYEDGQLILEKGSQRRAIFVVEKGQIQVERAPGEVIARRGQGAVFGEMSFLEGSGASASVVADGDVDVSVIAEAHLNSLLASVPGLATRFYQTLAVTLAYRLREASDRLARR